MKTSKPSSNDPGFSLVELLVVVGIIGLLLALLMPVLAKARKRGQGIVCLNNLHQQSLAIGMFLEDHGATYPNTNEVWSYYRQLLQPYMGTSPRSFSCPSDAFMIEPLTGSQRQQRPHLTAEYNFNSYFFNGRRPHHLGYPQLGLTGKQANSIHDPVRTIVFYEIPAGIPFSWHQGDRRRRPLARSNLAFADGHAALTAIFWNGRPRKEDLPSASDPPPSFDYRWSP